MSLQNREDEAELSAIEEMGGYSMADYPRIEFDRVSVQAAGKLLASKIPAERAADPDVAEAFRIAHNWRMAHSLPLVSERSYLRNISEGGVVTSGRIKRMASIRKKLAKGSTKLASMQDLSGIRAVLASVEDVRRVVQRIKDETPEGAWKESDYITTPKLEGYRSFHIIRPFGGGHSEGHYVGLKTEFQIRTRLQHVWATAQEAIGIATGQDLKGGNASPEWARFMIVMSAHFADLEDQPIGSNAPGNASDRARELRALDLSLGVISSLIALRGAVQRITERRSSAGFYIISMNVDLGTVNVVPVASIDSAAAAYDKAADTSERVQSVMVAADSIKALHDAYPNYFLDVGDFLSHAEAAMGRRTRPQSQNGPASDPPPFDLGWWFNRRNR